jgi:CheY-like chemotaxis protein
MNVLATVLATRPEPCTGQPRSVRPQAAIPSQSPEAAPRQFSARVLLVEDNPINQKVALNMLEKLGCQIDLASDGREALERIEGSSYDLVFMDVQMPVLDGLAATIALRERERGGQTHLPVIAMTAHAMTGDRERCLAAGMDDYVGKPVHLAMLERVLARRLPSPSQLPGSS